MSVRLSLALAVAALLLASSAACAGDVGHPRPAARPPRMLKGSSSEDGGRNNSLLSIVSVSGWRGLRLCG